MLDIEGIINRHLAEDKMEGKTFHEVHIVIDLFNCVREIERLRDEMIENEGVFRVLRRREQEAQAEVERLREHRESCTENLLKGYETGKTEERAAVVAWLREVADAPETWVDDAIALRGASASIERGEHRREEKP